MRLKYISRARIFVEVGSSGNFKRAEVVAYVEDEKREPVHGVWAIIICPLCGRKNNGRLSRDTI